MSLVSDNFLSIIEELKELGKKERKNNIVDFVMLASKLMKHRKADPYNHSSLTEYLSFDFWDIEDGLFLIAGLCPRIIDFEKDTSGSVRYRLFNLQPLHIPYDMYHLPPCRKKLTAGPILTYELLDIWLEYDQKPEDIVKDEAFTIEYDLIWSESELIEEKAICRPLFQKRLNQIRRLWDGGDHQLERYTPEYFINWAKSKGIIIEWLDWTIERGLVNPDQLKNYKKKDIDASVQFAEFGRKAHEYKKPIRDEFQTKIEKITIPLIEKGRNDTDITRDIYRYYKQPVGNKGEENSLQFELSSGEIIEYGFHTIRKMIPNFRK